jgi:hypothetical protein
MMMYNGLMDNFLPLIIDGLFWMHRDMRGDIDAKEVLMRLKMRSLRSGFQNPLTN